MSSIFSETWKTYKVFAFENNGYLETTVINNKGKIV